ncbi:MULTISPECIES: hypothetical protein [Pseudomonas]|uniref:Uncharacterized protein n=1 Tax=Pseudomonas serboccidentalis TaxID=2964670 RepID=A0ABY7Z416_9PSED|nr:MULTISPECIES: hypothetical protein [Pseudomonas]MBT9268005.1 hypothetical protein [Pseudomonas sp. MG-9]WDR34378.1 hypothetical protein NN484_17930 [Pseudomonas serboccidentalis]
MLLIQKEKSSIDYKLSGFIRTDGDLSVIGDYQNRLTGLPWLPGSGHTRCRPFAEKVRAMNQPVLVSRSREVLA